MHAGTTARAGNLWPTAELCRHRPPAWSSSSWTALAPLLPTHSPSIALVAAGPTTWSCTARSSATRGEGGDRARASALDVAIANEGDEGAACHRRRLAGSAGRVLRDREVGEGAFLSGSRSSRAVAGRSRRYAPKRLRRAAPATPAAVAERASPARSRPISRLPSPTCARVVVGSRRRRARRRGWPRRPPRPPRRFGSVRTAPSYSSPAASSRAPASPCTRRPEEQRLLRGGLRRGPQGVPPRRPLRACRRTARAAARAHAGRRRARRRARRRDGRGSALRRPRASRLTDVPRVARGAGGSPLPCARSFASREYRLRSSVYLH